jgi:exodeoxyribonuclease-3
LKIATWNVNSLRVRLEHVLNWLDSEAPDVLCLQETKTKDADFPVDVFTDLGYTATFNGQPTYNGVAVIAREEPSEVVTDLTGIKDAQRRLLGVTVGNLRIFDLYVPNGQSVGSEKYRYKLDWLEALAKDLERELDSHDQLVVVGDFNIAPEDRDVHDPVAWAGKVLCSEPERAALSRLLDLGLVDVFRQFDQAEKTFSWWDYRAGGFRRNLGLRIDLILASEAVAKRSRRCVIDPVPRGLQRPSDHAPVVAEFALD